MQSAIQRAASLIKQSDAILIGTGAGMGVDSGLEEFYFFGNFLLFFFIYVTALSLSESGRSLKVSFFGLVIIFIFC